MCEGGEGCGSDFDEGGNTGEVLGGGFEDSTETTEVTAAAESIDTETVEIPTTSLSEHEGIFGLGKIETSSRGVEITGKNDRVHGIDSKTTERYIPTSETVSNENFPKLAKQAKQQSYEYAAKMCRDRREDLSAKAKEGATEASLKKAGEFSENVLATHDFRTGDIRVSDIITEECAEHALNHEYMHSASYQSKEFSHNEKESVEKLISGIRETVYTTNNETGERIRVDKNISLNEGLTESYTLRSEKEMGIDHGTQATYSTNREYASVLEAVAGKEVVSEAYFNGMSQELADRCNELGKDENTWNDINSLLDIITNGKNTDTPEMREARMNARQELDNIFEKMNLNRMEEMKNAERNTVQDN